MEEKIKELFIKFRNLNLDYSTIELEHDLLQLLTSPEPIEEPVVIKKQEISRVEIVTQLMSGSMSNPEWANISQKVRSCYEIADEIIKQGGE